MSNEQISEMERLAEAMLSIAEIEACMQLPKDYLRDAIRFNDEIQSAFLRARAKTKMAVRDSVIKLAIAGSAPAQTLATNYIQECYHDDQI